MNKTIELTKEEIIQLCQQYARYIVATRNLEKAGCCNMDDDWEKLFIDTL